MNQEANEVERLLNSPDAAQLLREKDALRQLATAPETQRLMALLQASGANVQGAADAAIRGDTERLKRLLSEVSRSPEGARVVEGLRGRIVK